MEVPQIQPQAPETPQEAPRPTERPSAQIQALMRKEAEAVRKFQEAKKLEASIKAREAQLTEREAKVGAFETNWKDNPLKAVLDRGLTPEQLWVMQQQGGQPTAEVKIRMLEEELKSFRQERESDKTSSHKAQEQATQREVEDAQKTANAEASAYLEENKDKYPLTHVDGRADLVIKIIDRHYEKTLAEAGVGQEMPIEEAFKHVEAQLLKRAHKFAEVLQRTAPAKEPQTPPKPTGRYRFDEEPRFTENLESPKPVRTLAQVQQSVAPQVSRFKTDEEREANALALLRAVKQRRGLA